MPAFLRTLVVLVLLHVATSADYAPFVTFNNGLITADKNCTDLEMTLISDTVKKAAVQGARRRRRLGWDKQQHRRLGLLKCTPLMAWATSKCGGAKATRRRLQAQEAPTTAAMNSRKLQSNICDANITKFNAELDSVASKVSSKCSAFITTRSYECRQVLDCDIVAFHTWNAGNNTIFKSNFPAPGGGAKNTLCSRSNWAFQADSNFDVGTVQFSLRGGPKLFSVRDIGRAAPYIILGNNRTTTERFFSHGFTVNGNNTLLSVGTYTLSARAYNAPDSPHVAQFKVIDC